MYYGKKKGIITIVVLLLIILLVAGGVFTYLYLTTDLFKSNDAMFFKYMGKTIDDMKFTENTQLSTISKMQQQSPYTLDGSITFNAEGTNIDPAIKGLSKTKIEYLAKVDPLEEKTYAKATLDSDNNKIFELEYANSNNIYALKSDEIVSAFIGIENKDINSLKNKVGISGIDFADEVQTPNLINILTLTDSERQHIMDYYAQVLKDNIPSSAFTKESNISTKRDNKIYNTTGYRLNLTYTQLKNLEVALLRALKQDSITLNLISTKAKGIGLSDEYSVNNLSLKIDEYIAEIENSNYVGNDISIIVYVADGEVITTELLIKNNAKYTLSCKKTDTGVTRDLLIENFDVEGPYDNIKIKLIENNTSTQSFFDFTVTVNDANSISIGLTNEGGAQQKLINSTFDVSYTDETGNIYALEVKQKMEFVDEIKDLIELSRSNCGVLNDYTDEQVSTLMLSIIERIKYVFEEKKALLAVNGSNEINPIIGNVQKEQEIQTFNAQFESYIGKISGTSLNTLNTVVKKHNENNESKKVILTVNGINTAGDSKSIDNNKTYYVGVTYDSEGYVNAIYASDDNETLEEYLQQNNVNTNEQTITNETTETNTIF